MTWPLVALLSLIVLIVLWDARPGWLYGLVLPLAYLAGRCSRPGEPS